MVRDKHSQTAEEWCQKDADLSYVYGDIEKVKYMVEKG
jgi:hypothetical protein